VGYVVYTVRFNPRYSTSLQAVQDILFVDRSRRGALIGKRLIEFSYDRLRAEGVQLVLQHCKVSPEIKALLAEMKDRKDVGKLFELMGHDLIDFIHAKRLDR
jgi:GNAT superfamily N-acetyltransferase